MSFEEEILRSRAGEIRVSPHGMLKYVIFENIAKHVGVDESSCEQIVQELTAVAQEFRTQAKEELRCKYQMLYYRLAVIGYPLMLPLAAQLPEADMPEPVAEMIARRNRVLRAIYDESFKIPEPEPKKGNKRLKWEDVITTEMMDSLLNDEKETRKFGNNSVEVYKLDRKLYKLAFDWRKTKNITYLYEYHITLYQLIILGFDPLEMDVFAEINEPSEIPAYYWELHKE